MIEVNPMFQFTTAMHLFLKKLEESYSNVSQPQPSLAGSSTRGMPQDIRPTFGQEGIYGPNGYEDRKVNKTNNLPNKNNGEEIINVTIEHPDSNPNEKEVGVKNSPKAFYAEEYRFQQATREVLDYYNKKPQFTGSIDEVWQRHIQQLNLICQVYKTNDNDNILFFGH